MRICMYCDYEIEGQRFRAGDVIKPPPEVAMFLVTCGAALVEQESQHLTPPENAMKPRPMPRPSIGVRRNG
jgi:hypothetical protein